MPVQVWFCKLVLNLMMWLHPPTYVTGRRTLLIVTHFPRQYRVKSNEPLSIVRYEAIWLVVYEGPSISLERIAFAVAPFEGKKKIKHGKRRFWEEKETIWKNSELD